jgi:hypothetical protein
VLTNYATVSEVVDAFTDPSIYIVPMNFGPGFAGHPTVHLSVTDASGDSAIIEYLGGKPVIHHGRQYQVMTNSPTYDEQLKLNAEREKKDRNTDLPGSIQSEDRFVRASYYLSKLPQTVDERQSVAGVFSVMRNVSVPWGVGDPEHPNLSPTYWRSVADSTNKVYYFESALSPNIVWVNLKNVNLGPGSGTRAVAVENNYSIIGNIDKALAPAQPITYLAPTAANTPKPGVTAPEAPTLENKSGFTAWWLLPIVALLGLLAVLPRLFRKRSVAEHPVDKVREEILDVKTEIHEARGEAQIEHEVGPIVRYETDAPAGTTIEVTYENNALGDHQESRADKSDRTPD